MKKNLILLLIILLAFNSFVYANNIDTDIQNLESQSEVEKIDNTLQKEYESSHYNLNNNIDSYYLLKEDYDLFTSDKSDGRSFLGTLNFKISNNNIKKEEKEYYQQIINNLINAIEQNATITPILVNNNIYKNFSIDLKDTLAMYNNSFVDKPVNIFQYSDEQYNLDDLNIDEIKDLPEPKLTKGEKIDYNLNKIIGMPFTIVDNIGKGKFNKFWVDDNLEAEYTKKIDSRKAEIENRKAKIEKKNEEIITVLYLRAFEEKACNTAILASNPKISYDNKEYSGDELLKEINNTDTQVEKLYKAYKSNPNDMKRNAELIKIMGISKGKYSYFIKTIKKDVIDKTYEIYINSYNSQKSRGNIKFKDPLPLNNPETAVGLLDKSSFSIRLYDKNSWVKAHDLMIDKIDTYDNYAKDVSTYSYTYEKKKYNDWATRNGKKQIKGSLEEFVYNSFNNPVTNGLYTHNPVNNLFLKVLQTVPGGVILTGTYIGGNIYGVNLIYLQTTKPYADGQYIKEPIIAEFKGYYDYTTVLGVKKRIYKFYRYGQKEIDANFKIPGQPFYFYSY